MNFSLQQNVTDVNSTRFFLNHHLFLSYNQTFLPSRPRSLVVSLLLEEIYNKVLKFDVTNVGTFEIMGFVSIFGKNMMKNAHLAKISILLRFEGEILTLL